MKGEEEIESNKSLFPRESIEESNVNVLNYSLCAV